MTYLLNAMVLWKNSHHKQMHSVNSPQGLIYVQCMYKLESFSSWFFIAIFGHQFILYVNCNSLRHKGKILEIYISRKAGWHPTTTKSENSSYYMLLFGISHTVTVNCTLHKWQFGFCLDFLHGQSVSHSWQNFKKQNVLVTGSPCNNR